MNAKDIVEMLREYLQSSAPNQLDSKFANAVWDATSLLESQQDRITELEAQLLESQRRERAAVEDWKIYEDSGQCDVCKYGECGGCTYPERGRCHFKWRGHQEAGKGDTK